MNQRTGQGQLLAHAAGKLACQSCAERLQPAELHQALKTRNAILPGDGIQVGKEFEIFLDGQLAIETETL
jgi:hypothetical protein